MVPEFLSRKELLKPPLFRCFRAFDELRPKLVVGSIVGWVKHKIVYLHGDFWAQGGNHVVELCPLSRDVPSGELGFHLRKPDGRVSGPEQRQL